MKKVRGMLKRLFRKEKGEPVAPSPLLAVFDDEEFRARLKTLIHNKAKREALKAVRKFQKQVMRKIERESGDYWQHDYVRRSE